jgi:hypothetical protein
MGGRTAGGRGRSTQGNGRAASIGWARSWRRGRIARGGDRTANSDGPGGREGTIEPPEAPLAVRVWEPHSKSYPTDRCLNR